MFQFLNKDANKEKLDQLYNLNLNLIENTNKTIKELLERIIDLEQREKLYQTEISRKNEALKWFRKIFAIFKPSSRKHNNDLIKRRHSI